MIIRTRIAAYLLASLVVYCGESKAFECSLDRFLGPPPRVKYIYSASDGSRIEITGVSIEKNETIRIIETVFFPEDGLPSDMPKSSSFEYNLAVHGNTLIKESKKGKETVLQEPLTTESKQWKIKGKAGSKDGQREAKWKNIESVCKIVRTDKAYYFEKERFTITTECITANNLSTTQRLETYAEGIGLIERVINVTLKDGKAREIYRLSLKRIIETKCENTQQP